MFVFASETEILLGSRIISFGKVFFSMPFRLFCPYWYSFREKGHKVTAFILLVASITLVVAIYPKFKTEMKLYRERAHKTASAGMRQKTSHVPN